MRQLLQAESYKIHFILGAIGSAIGVGAWILFYFGMLSVYPIKMHSQLMILGFLFSFVSGFLMTAIPRMTGTNSATLLEKASAHMVVILFLILTTMEQQTYAFLASSMQFVFLITFFLRRLIKMRGRSLPTGFIFIPLGLASGFVGSALLFMANYGHTRFMAIGKVLLYEGLILNLIIGLGSRLIPVLTRKSGVLSPGDVNFVSNRVFFIEAVVFNGSFFIAEYFNDQVGIAIRCVVMFFILYKNFRFFKPMTEKSKLGIGILTSAASLPISYMFILFLPSYRGHLMHILYIMSFALLTFLVSVRVSLAHGGASLEIERSSNSVLFVIIAFAIAMFTRVFGAILSGSFIMAAYAAAALFFLLGLLSWVYLLRSTLFAKVQND